MKILYYSPHPDLALQSASGYGTHMREMIKAFEQGGHLVKPVIIGGVEESAPGKAVEQNSQMKSLAKRCLPRAVWEAIKDLSLLREDRRFQELLDIEVQDYQPDLIYERANYMQLSGVNVAKKYDIPHILEMNSPYLEEKRVYTSSVNILAATANRIERSQLELSDRVCVVSAALSDHLVTKHQLSPEKFLCTPNAIDPSFVCSESNRVAQIIEQHQLQGKTVIGFIGSIIQWQRVDLLIEACAHLGSNIDRVKVLIVGDSSLVPGLKLQCKKLGLDRHISFVGRVAHREVFNYIDAMDITVLPDNLWYGSPTKIFEYGALGKAVIAPNNSTVRQLIVDGEEGLLVRPDSRDLAHAINRLIEDDVLYKRVSQSFQHKVRNVFTWAKNAEIVLQPFGKILSKPGPKVESLSVY